MGNCTTLWKKRKNEADLFYDVIWKRGGFVPQTNKKFRTLNVGGGVTILFPLSNFSAKKVLFCTHFTNWFKSFLCFWRGFFMLNFRIGLENCTWSVNSDIIQLIFFRGEGVFVFFIFIFIYPAAKKYGSLLFSSHLFPWYKTGWESLNWFTAEILIGRYFKPCFHIFLLIPVIWIRSTSLKSRKNPVLTR